MEINGTGQVVACIPYFRCQKYIRRAVSSLLDQTYRNITVIVVNDGDFETPPWPCLSDITDCRLLRFDLSENKGPYFITQLILASIHAPYLLIQDADDWSHPERVEKLVNALEVENSDYAVSAQPTYRKKQNGSYELLEIRWIDSKHANNMSAICNHSSLFKIDMQLTSSFRYRAPHHGLFRIATLHNIGGYHPEFRINYDALVPNLILMIGKISHIKEPLYYRFIRHDSLTHSNVTGTKSLAAYNEKQKSLKLYNECYKSYAKFINGTLTSSGLIKSIRNICNNFRDEDLKYCLQKEILRLKEEFSGRSSSVINPF